MQMKMQTLGPIAIHQPTFAHFEKRVIMADVEIRIVVGVGVDKEWDVSMVQESAARAPDC